VTKNYNPKRGAHRVGVIIPSVNATTEPDFAWAGPAGISFHAMRVMLHETTPDGLRAMNTELDGAAHRIASVTPDVVAYACTAGTFLEGKAALTQQIERIAIGNEQDAAAVGHVRSSTKSNCRPAGA